MLNIKLPYNAKIYYWCLWEISENGPKYLKHQLSNCTGINAYLIIMTDCTQPLPSQCTISLKEHFHHLAHDGNFLIQTF